MTVVDYVRPKNGLDSLPQFLQSLANRETGGQPDPYKAEGKKVTTGEYKGDRAYGKYQIMGKNIPQWTEQYLGKKMSVKEFIDDPHAQDMMMAKRATELYGKYGSWGDVASVHFTGQPLAIANPNVKDDNGTAAHNYVEDVINGINWLLGGGTAHAETTPDASGAAPTSTQTQMPKTLTLDQVKQNMQALKDQGASHDAIQGYLNTLSKNTDGTYGNKASQEASQQQEQPQTWFDKALGYAHTAADWVGQNVLAPSVDRFAASGIYMMQTAGEATAELGGDMGKAQQLDTERKQEEMNGFNFGIFGQGVRPIGMGVDGKPMFDITNPQSNGQDFLKMFGDAASAGLNTAALDPALYGGKLMAPAADVVKEGVTQAVDKTAGVGGKVLGKLAAGAVKAAPGAAVQTGADVATQVSKGQKPSAKQAAGEFAQLTTALGVMNAVGNKFGIIGNALSKTKAGIVLGDFINSQMQSFKNLITDTTKKANASAFTNAVATAAWGVGQQIGGILKGLVDNKNGLFPAYPDDMAQQLRSITQKGTDAAYSALRSKFWKPLEDSGFAVTKDELQGTLAKLDELAPNVSVDKGWGPKTVDEWNRFIAGGTDALNKGLDSWVADFKSVVDPAMQKGELSFSDLYKIIQQVRPRGTDKDKAIEAQTLDVLYKEFEGAMQNRAPDLMKAWQTARTQSTNLGVLIDKGLQFVPGENIHPTQIIKSIINRVGGDADALQALHTIYGQDGMKLLQGGIMRYITEGGAKSYENTLITAGEHGADANKVVPEAVKKAGSTAASFIESEMEKAKSILTPPMQNVLLNTSALAKFNHEDIAKMVPGGEELLQHMQDISRLTEAFKTGELNPSQLAEQLANAPIETIRAAKGMLQGTTVEVNGQKVSAWDVVSANTLQNFANDVGGVLSHISDPGEAERFLQKFGSMGAGQGSSQDAFNEFFGDNPRLREGIDKLYNAVEYIRSQEKLGEEGITKVKDAVATFVFAYTHHPVMAYSYGRKLVTGAEVDFTSQASREEMAQIGKKVETMLKEGGQVSASWWRKMFSAGGKFLKSALAQIGVTKEISNLNQ